MRSKFSNLEDEEDDGDEADWKDSYSDLVTDLLCCICNFIFLCHDESSHCKF
jgi:hypothetical protein